MDSSVSETYGDQEGSAYNGHFACTCYHPLFCFNQFGDVEGTLLREGNVHSAKDWQAVLEPIVARYRGQEIDCYFRGDAAFANPDIYEYLEGEGFLYAIRLPANDTLNKMIEPLTVRPVGRPPEKPQVRYRDFAVSGQELELSPPGDCQSGMAPGRIVPSYRIHRHQSEPVGKTGGAFLQSAGDGGAVDQGGQECHKVDTAFLS